MSRPRMYLLAYAPGDIDRFTPRADFALEKAAVGWAWAEGPPPGRTWTLFEEGAVLGVGGVFDAGKGKWQAWAVLAELTRRQWCVAGQLAEEALLGVERFNRPEAITATARTSIAGARPMLEKLGFTASHLFVDPRIGREVLYQRMVRAA